MEVYDIELIPLIIGLISLIKKTTLPKRYIPIFSIFIGILFSFIFSSGNWQKDILVGVYLGLSAMGLYSGSKTILKSETEKKVNL